MKKEGISIVIPVYNTKKYLKKCVDSIVNQDFNNYEIIIVDDGSDMETAELCDQIAKEYPKISVIHKINGGLTSARYAGFCKANMKYIYFPDSDDFLADDSLNRMYSVAQKNQCDMVVFGFYRFDNKNSTEQKIDLPNIIDDTSLLKKYLIDSAIGGIHDRSFFDLPTYMWMRLFKTDLVDETMFFSEKEYYTEDSLFVLEYLKSCKKICAINEPLYYYRFNPESLTNRYRENKWEMLFKRQKFYLNYFKNDSSDEVKKRLDYSLFNALFWSLHNYAHFLKYNDYKIKASEIFQQNEVELMLKKIDVKYMNVRQKMLRYAAKTKKCKMSYLILRF